MPDRKKLVEITDPSMLDGEEVAVNDGGVSQEIADEESNGGNYSAFNPHTHALGKYQFVPSHHWKDIQRVTGAKSEQEFLKDPQKQEDFYAWHAEHNLKPSAERLSQFNQDGYSDSQLRKLVHFKGEGGAKEWLTSHKDRTTANNESIDDYVGKPEGAVKPTLTEVADPSLIEGEEVAPEDATANNSQNNPLAPIPQAAPVVPDGLTKKDPVTGLPILENAPIETPVQRTAAAGKYIADDVLSASKDIPLYEQNIKTTSFDQPGNIVHDLTDTHGNPALTGGYAASRISQLSKERAQAIERAQADDTDGTKVAHVTHDYDQKIAELRDNSSHILDLQLANKYYQDAGRHGQKPDAVQLGVEKQIALGNKQAEEDKVKLANGKRIDPAHKVAYQSMGLAILKTGAEVAADSGREAVAESLAKHAENPQAQLEKDNPEYFKKQYANEIADDIYKNENGVYGTIFSHQLTQDDIDKSAKKLGINAKKLGITPEDVPSSSSIYGQAMQGFVNTAAAPIYEGGMHALAALGIADKQAVNERFKPGWEEESGMGSLFTGQTPQAQRELTIHNPRGIVATMAKGVGDLGGFLLNAEGVSSLLKGSGITKDALKASSIANFATAALPSYNSAYEKSMSVIGDKPDEEAARQVYSVLNGVIGGAVMMIDPKADIARDILGVTTAGKSVIAELKSGNFEKMGRDGMKDKLTQVVSETAKHLGLQIAIPTIQTMAGNMSDMIFDPKGHHELTDNVGQAATSGAIAMFIPSLMAGAHAPANQTAMNKSIFWDVAKNARDYRNEVGRLYQAGDMSREDFQKSLDGINDASGILRSKLPTVDISTGKELTPDQKQDYAWSLFKSDDLSKRLQAAEATGDKAQVGQVKKMISATEKERADILSAAGELKPSSRITLQPQTELGAQGREVFSPRTQSGEKPTEDPNEERSVATAADKGEGVDEQISQLRKERDAELASAPDHYQFSALDNETKDIKTRYAEKEKKLLESKENVSLNHNLVTQKNESDGQDENKGRLNEDSAQDSETPGGEEGAIIREAASLEGRQAPEDGLLSPKAEVVQETEKKTGGEAAIQPPPEAVSGKKKRRFVNEDEEPATIQEKPTEVLNAERSVATEPAIEAKAEPPTESTDASTQTKERNKEGIQQGGESEHARAEQAGSEVAPTEAKSGDSNIGGAKEEKIAPPAPVAPPKKKVRKGKQWNMSAHLDRRTKVLQEEPHSIEEYILSHMLGGMTDKEPQNKWLRTESTTKNLPKGAEERRGQNNFLSDHPQAIDIDKWSQDVANAAEQNQLPFSLNGMDSKDISDIVHEMISGNPTKTKVMESLEALHEKRKSPEDHQSEAEYEASKALRAQREAVIKEIEADETRQEQHSVVSDVELKDEEWEAIHDYLSAHVGEDGKIKTKELDPFEDDYQDAYKKLSKEGRDLLDSLLSADEQRQSEAFQSSKEKIYGKEKGLPASAERSTGVTGQEEQSQGDATRDSGPEGRGQAQGEEGGSADNEGPRELAPEAIKAPDERLDVLTPKEIEARNQTKARIAEIDNSLVEQRAVQRQVSEKRKAAEKAGNIEEANKQNENWYKKQDRIEKLEAEKDALIKQQSEQESEDRVKVRYSKMANYVVEQYAKNKAAHKGIATSSITGLTHKIGDHVADYLVARLADGIRELGNLHVAIARAIRQTKSKFGEEAAKLSREEDADIIAANFGMHIPPQDRPPVLNIANEEAAKDVLADIRSGMAYKDAIDEIMNDDGLSDKTRAKIINYLDWHLKDQETHNSQTLREPDYGNKYLDGYSLTGSGETSAYISGKTLADVHGKDVQFDIESKEAQLQKNIVQDTANMVGLAKKHTGSDDPLVFGADMLHQLNRIPDSAENGVKKVLAVSGLNNELHAERIRVEEQFKNPIKGQGFTVENNGTKEQQKRLRDLDRMIAQVEIRYRDITSNASNVLNAARANRIFRNTYFHDLYADKILDEKQQREKQATEEALLKTEVPDHIAEEGPLREAEDAQQTVDEVIKEKEKSKSGREVANDVTGKKDKRQPPEGKEKSKGVIDKLKDRFKKKDKSAKEGEGAEPADKRKEVVTKDVAAKKSEEYLQGATEEDLFEKAKQQTKKPC